MGAPWTCPVCSVVIASDTTHEVTRHLDKHSGRKLKCVVCQESVGHQRTHLQTHFNANHRPDGGRASCVFAGCAWTCKGDKAQYDRHLGTAHPAPNAWLRLSQATRRSRLSPLTVAEYERVLGLAPGQAVTDLDQGPEAAAWCAEAAQMDRSLQEWNIDMGAVVAALGPDKLAEHHAELGRLKVSRRTPAPTAGPSVPRRRRAPRGLQPRAEEMPATSSPSSAPSAPSDPPAPQSTSQSDSQPESQPASEESSLPSALGNAHNPAQSRPLASHPEWLGAALQSLEQQPELPREERSEWLRDWERDFEQLWQDDPELPRFHVPDDFGGSFADFGADMELPDDMEDFFN